MGDFMRQGEIPSRFLCEQISNAQEKERLPRGISVNELSVPYLFVIYSNPDKLDSTSTEDGTYATLRSISSSKIYSRYG